MRPISAQGSMFSSASANKRRRVQLDPSPSTSSVVTQTAVRGRKRKANFSNKEVETLVWNIAQHFNSLYGSKTIRAKATRRKQIWTQIQSHVNFIGSSQRSVDDLKHKWRDLRLDVKKKVMVKKSLAPHQAGGSSIPQLTPLETKVASMFFQPSHDPEPKSVLDPEINLPGTSKQKFGTNQATTSHPGIYSHTKGQPSTLPKMEDFVGPHLGVRSPDQSVTGDDSGAEEQSSSADSEPELQISESSSASPPRRNDSDTSEEEDAEGLDRDEGLDPPFSDKEDPKFSSRQSMLRHHSSSQGSPASEPEEMLTPEGANSEWGDNMGADLGPQTEEEESEPPNTDLGSVPQGLESPVQEKQPYEDQQQQPSMSPLNAGIVTEESLPPVSSGEDRVSPSHSLPQEIKASRPRKRRRSSCRTAAHRFIKMEKQWERIYYHELAMWKQAQAQHQEERARDRDLQLQLLAVLKEICTELRCSRQERKASCRELGSQTSMALTSPSLTPKPEASVSKPSWCPEGTSFLNGGRGERGRGSRGPQGISRRGRGRPRGCTSHNTFFVGNK